MMHQPKTIEEFISSPKNHITIVLDNIRSLNNVGAFFRTADSFLLEGIYLCGITGKPPHREIEKTALGATLSVHWEYFYDTSDAIKKLQFNHYKIYCIEQYHQSIPLHKINIHPDDKIALVFGNEITGIQTQILSMCDAVIEIPQMGTKHSLNVSVCGGIACWEFIKKMTLSVE